MSQLGNGVINLSYVRCLWSEFLCVPGGSVRPLQPGSDEESEEMPIPESETVQVIPGSELLWRITPRPENTAQVRVPKYILPV